MLTLDLACQHAHPPPPPLPAQDVPAGASPLPGFFRWAAAQEVAGKLEFEVKGDAESAAWAADAAEASKLSAAAPGPAFPTAAEEEAACAAPAAEARR